MDFQIAKQDLHRCRFIEQPAPELAPGEARLAVSSFGLTANNITYAVFGEAMSYWDLFPAAEGFGRMPVWGFADVSESRVETLAEGTRVFGYLPPSSELVVAPARVDARGFSDGSPHRGALAAAYNAYVRVDADPIYDERREDEQALLRPLFFTAYMIDDLLADSAFFGAEVVLLSSASSKTASALAFLLSKREGIDVVALTSARSAEFARGLGVYDAVISYEELESLPQGRVVYVDMAGDAALRETVHRRYRQQLRHSAVVGATHHADLGALPDDLPGPRPAFFFAPERVAKRRAEWGGEGLEGRLAAAWHPYVEWTGGWLEVIHGRGAEALQSAYLDLLDGRIDPARAHVLTLQP